MTAASREDAHLPSVGDAWRRPQRGRVPKRLAPRPGAIDHGWTSIVEIDTVAKEARAEVNLFAWNANPHLAIGGGG